MGKAVKNTIKLYTIKEVPDFLINNDKIRSGYRKDLSVRLCWKSIFMWTNQTLNIWSHTIGFCFFSLVLIYENIVTIPRYGWTLEQRVLSCLTLVCYQVCMLASAGYHAFHCQRERTCSWWLLRDFDGMLIAFGGSSIHIEYYLFYCDTFWRNFHIALTICFLIAAMYPSIRCPERCDKTLLKGAILRVVAFLGTCSISTIHFIIRGGWSDGFVQYVIVKQSRGYQMLFAAVLVYVSRIPERFWPGKVDYIGNSHLWWHIMIVISEYYMYDFMRDLALNWAGPCH